VAASRTNQDGRSTKSGLADRKSRPGIGEVTAAWRKQQEMARVLNVRDLLDYSSLELWVKKLGAAPIPKT
jgi:hypothetical protein